MTVAEVTVGQRAYQETVRFQIKFVSAIQIFLDWTELPDDVKESWEAAGTDYLKRFGIWDSGEQC